MSLYLQARMNEQIRKRIILDTLKKAYPHAAIALFYSSPWELLVAVILSAQCTDKVVNTVTPQLFASYPTPKSMAQAKREDVENLIKKTGFYTVKTTHIIQTANRLVDAYDENIPKTMADLITLPGVGRKTANVVLYNAFHIIDGIAIDTHVHRITQRLGLVSIPKDQKKKPMMFDHEGKPHIDYYKGADPNSIEKLLMKEIPKNDWGAITYRIIDHGRAVCKSRHPLCDVCPLKSYCASSRSTS